MTSDVDRRHVLRGTQADLDDGVFDSAVQDFFDRLLRALPFHQLVQDDEVECPIVLTGSLRQ